MTPEVLIDNEALEVLWLEGRGDRMVVSFTGIGLKDRPVQGIEFPKIAHQGGENHVLFIVDRKRSWYNWPGLAERIIEVVRARAEAVGATRLMTIGNSMGGYGSVLFANPVGAELAISFVPQFTMNDRVVREVRWQEYKRAMPSFYVDSLAGSMAPPTRFFMLHGAVGRDAKHYRRFPTGAHIRHYVLPGRTHAAATHMKAAGRLDPLVQALLDGDDAGVARIMAGEGAHLRDPARPFEGLRLWAAARSSETGHGMAQWLVNRIAGPARQEEVA